MACIAPTARREAPREQVRTADGKLEFGRFGQKSVARSEGGVRRRGFGLGLGESQRVTRGLPTEREQERPQALE